MEFVVFVVLYVPVLHSRVLLVVPATYLACRNLPRVGMEKLGESEVALYCLLYNLICLRSTAFLFDERLLKWPPGPPNMAGYFC